MNTLNRRETLLVVDDLAENIDLMVDILRDKYRVLVATNGTDALATALTCTPDLILLDVMMPGMNGYETCQHLKSDGRTSNIPIIFVTALGETRDEQIGLELGAVDFLHKPCHPAIVQKRVRLHLDLRNQHRLLEAKVQERTRQLEESRLEVIRRLGRAAEYRDNETGMHVIRMSHTARLIALAIDMPEAQAELLFLAAPMHDIGKIGISDHILLKPGKLDAAEWEIMKTHTLIGGEIIGEHDSDLLRLARSVALTHHEKWDGSGYPLGLAGAAIPLEGRVVSIADVYDALTSERPYKRAWSSDDALAYIRSETGKSFDPALIPAFLQQIEQVQEIGARFSDSKQNFVNDDGLHSPAGSVGSS
jgi:putative two-component system response regulator